VTLELSHLIALLSLIFSITTAAIALSVRNATRHAKIEERVSLLETRLSLLWRPIEERVAQMFKMPTHHRLDELLEKYRQGALSYEEAAELSPLLEARLGLGDLSEERMLWGYFLLQAIAWEQYRQGRQRWGASRPSWWQRVRRWIQVLHGAGSNHDG
jgi:hypothetical protein